MHDTDLRHIITQGQMLMPPTPASAAAKLNLMFIAFAFATAPVIFGSAAVCALADHRLISYWWLALTLGWAVVPSAILTRANRYQRQARAARLAVTARSQFTLPG